MRGGDGLEQGEIAQRRAAGANERFEFRDQRIVSGPAVERGEARVEHGTLRLPHGDVIDFARAVSVASARRLAASTARASREASRSDTRSTST